MGRDGKKEMNIIEQNVKDLIPYKNNPRHNDQAVDAVAKSIKEFGFKVPIIVDRNNTIVAGHTRLKAAMKLGLETVPTMVADDLSEQQIRAFRIADNKLAELATWDFEKLEFEMQDLDLKDFGFKSWFDREELEKDKRQEGNEEYNSFLDKFETPKTTDDCYTPQNVYDAVAQYVEDKYGFNKEKFVRPFYPGGDYVKYKYAEDAVVVDNPPFSIMSEILKFYTEKKIKFFLFAPALTLFSSLEDVCAIGVGVSVTYENKAKVATSFLTNMEDKRLRSDPELYQIVKQINDENERADKKEIHKYEYPDYIVCSTDLSAFSKYGVNFELSKKDSVRIRELDAQKEAGKAIYGSGYLLSEKAAAKKAAAEKAAAEKAAAKKWELSEREMEIVKSLG